ncbi:MAG: restriction endonuclease [Acidobacteria bacterium]|nr:restriction endonuclease [Acidobacteriota bacterium]
MRYGSYRPMWEVEVRHEGLHKYRHIRGSDKHVVEQKARAQELEWAELWERYQEAERKQRERDELWNRQMDKKQQVERIRINSSQQAHARTAEAQALFDSLRKTLLHTLRVNDVVDWEKLKDRRPFTEPAPTKTYVKGGPPMEPVRDKVPAPPYRENYNPNLGLLGRIIPAVKARRQTEAELAFGSDYQSWLSNKNAIEERNVSTLRQYETALKKYEVDQKRLVAEYATTVSLYEQERIEYESGQMLANETIEQKKADYLAGEGGAIIDYCEMVLSNSDYNLGIFPKDFDIDYDSATKMLLVDYSLPSLDNIPTLKEVRYIATKNEFKEMHLSEREVNALYDDLIYQVTLRSIHELFEADVAGAVDAIVLNGVVTSVNKATGHPVTSCILSIQAKKEEFLKIDLAQVDPKACFKALKGVGSSKLHSMTAVPPIMTINREDTRFIDARAVAGSVDDSTNLAAVDWEDFEHLIREVFEWEFAKSGGEVRVTQASRDRGVDAIAFDPDPIRGGKVVIQAKRYTNTVGVSAVRDLYGTVINEGATKGILITTSDYGPDSYDFARDKPLVLLNGGHLLGLLEKHGRRARIDLNEAKKQLLD